MAIAKNKKNNSIHSKRRSKSGSMTKSEMVQKMLADQQIIREARQKGISYKELEKLYGFKFARLLHLQNK